MKPKPTDVFTEVVLPLLRAAKSQGTTANTVSSAFLRALKVVYGPKRKRDGSRPGMPTQGGPPADACTAPCATMKKSKPAGALLRHASQVFADKAAAAVWLKTPQVGLGGAVPNTRARTAKGRSEVKTLLTRIDYGLVS